MCWKNDVECTLPWTMFKVVQHDQQGTMKTIVEVGHKTTFIYHLHAL
jgi:hypothetical protein